MRIVLVGANHRTANLELRERLAFSHQQIPEALASLREQFGSIEAAILSTCNRSELYLARPAHGQPQFAQIIQFLAQRGQADAGDIEKHVYHYQDARAVGHLFAVASSLDSMVVGETQIAGQVNQALKMASQAGTAGTYINQLFQRALSVGKSVRSETAITEGHFSIGSVAAEFAGQIFTSLADKTIAVVGAGKMGTVTLRHLIEQGCGRLLVCNRTYQRAVELAETLRGQPVSFEKIDWLLEQSDIVITSVGADRPIIQVQHIRQALRKRNYKTMFLLDIAVPRNISPEVASLQGVYLYNIDDLQTVLDQHDQQRTTYVESCQQIIDRAVDVYLLWQRRRTVAPVIVGLRRKMHQIGQEQLAWLDPKINGLSDQQRLLVEQMAHRIIHQVLNTPTSKLVQHLDQSSVEAYAATLENLFEIIPEPPDQGHGADEIKPQNNSQ